MKFSEENISNKKYKQIEWYGNSYIYKILPSKISLFFKKYFIKKLFKTQKGYRFLLKNYGNDYYYKIIEDFSKVDLHIKENHFSKLIFGNNIHDKELIIKQYLLRYFYPLTGRKEISFQSGRRVY